MTGDSNAEESTPLAASLESAAAAELTRAIADFASSNHRGFYVHAGAALELEVKAALARLNPLLILNPKSSTWDRDAKRILTGTPLTAGEGLRTISAAEAVSRLKTLQPKDHAELPTLSTSVFQARNDVVHAGVVHDDEHESHIGVASAFFQAVLILRASMANTLSLRDNEVAGEGPDFTIFGSSANLVEEVVSTNTNAEKVAANRSVEQARQRFEALENDQQDMLRAASVVRINEESGLFALSSICVACGSAALAEGTLDAVDLREDGVIGEESVILIFDHQACYVCGLRISSRQLSLLGKHNAAIHPTVTAADFNAQYEHEWNEYGPDTSDYEPDWNEYGPDPSDYS